VQMSQSRKALAWVHEDRRVLGEPTWEVVFSAQ
jgi:hypothetical protein